MCDWCCVYVEVFLLLILSEYIRWKYGEQWFVSVGVRVGECWLSQVTKLWGRT